MGARQIVVLYLTTMDLNTFVLLHVSAWSLFLIPSFFSHMLTHNVSVCDANSDIGWYRLSNSTLTHHTYHLATVLFKYDSLYLVLPFVWSCCCYAHPSSSSPSPPLRRFTSFISSVSTESSATTTTSVWIPWRIHYNLCYKIPKAPKTFSKI